jgi:hypothetical protein
MVANWWRFLDFGVTSNRRVNFFRATPRQSQIGKESIHSLNTGSTFLASRETDAQLLR